jgi:hypothetical protein
VSSEIRPFSSHDPDVSLTHQMRIALVDTPGQQICSPAGQPVAALILDACHAKDGDARVRPRTFICTWEQLAALSGQLRVWREMLPVDRRDQADAVADAYERYAREALG